MKTVLSKAEIEELKMLLKNEKIKIPFKEAKDQLQLIINSQQIFPLNMQRLMILRLLYNYNSTKKKEVIYLEEINKKKSPETVVIGVLAEDWPGMSNSILGIIHHIAKNVHFVKGFTIPDMTKTIGIVILAFVIEDREEYSNFVKEKKSLIKKIRSASRGTRSKFILLDEETVKFNIFDKLIERIKNRFKGGDINALIGETGEALKFVLSRSKEYLEERKIKDLADLIIENYKCQQYIREGRGNEVIRIKNFETFYEKLTGITFVCKELVISIEDFLKTLEYIVPDYVIKHHKSFVTRDGLLVYRLEIVTRQGLPLEPALIKSIQNSLKRIIISTQSTKFRQIKSIGGYEHFARAIIPFLMDEYEKTGVNQVFFNVLNKTDFNIELKLIIVRGKSNNGKIKTLIPKLDKLPGAEVNSFTPTKLYREHLKVDILKLNLDFSEFNSIREIFDKLKSLVQDEFGEIRDFDQGLRNIYIRKLNRLEESLPEAEPKLIRDIFFNFDDMFRVEIELEVLYEIISLCWRLIEAWKKDDSKIERMEVKFLPAFSRVLMVVSCHKEKSLLKIFMSHFLDIDINFSKFYRDQKKYYILILDNRENRVKKEKIDSLKKKLR